DLEELLPAETFTIDKPAHPLVAAHAAWLRAIAAEARGRREPLDLGLLETWSVVGPFDNEGKKGFSEVYPPEKETTWEGARTYRGKERAVGWRAADPVIRRGVVPLDGLLRPDTNVIGYAVAFFQLEGDADVAVRVGSTGAIKVWIDGREVIAHDVYRP